MASGAVAEPAQSQVEEPEVYNRSRVTPKHFLPGRFYAGAYAGEHVAGGEFVVGAAIAAWGASPKAVLLGLLLGNTLAVLSWALVCSPIATRARITLYYYLERLAGRRLTQCYNILNGAIMAVIAGGLITIAASAVRVWADIPPQINWYPTSPIFVLLACLLGVATMYVTVRGFATFSRFASVCSPWIISLFFVMALASIILLVYMVGDDFHSVHDLFATYIWNAESSGSSKTLNLWEIAAFAWGLNVPMHLGMGDLSTLRFARKWTYGFNSFFAAFGGHFLAWICASMLGATTAMMLNVSVESLDMGGVVAPLLSTAGLIGIILACFTTSVPSLYRAGLAFHSLNPSSSRAKATIVVGVITTFVACFPLIFLKWLDLMAYFNILLSPIGAVIISEHYLLPRFGIEPFWHEKTGRETNLVALTTWIVGFVLAVILWLIPGVHLFFIFIPVTLVCLVFYTLVVLLTCSEKQPEQAVETLYTQAYGDDSDMVERTDHTAGPSVNRAHGLQALAWLSLVAIVLSPVILLLGSDPESSLPYFHYLLAALSVVYFIFGMSYRVLETRRLGKTAV